MQYGKCNWVDVQKFEDHFLNKTEILNMIHFPPNGYGKETIKCLEIETRFALTDSLSALNISLCVLKIENITKTFK